MNFNDLVKNSKTLATAFNIPVDFMPAIIELLKKKTIAKPAKLFKDCTPKVKVSGEKNFMFIETSKNNCFFNGGSFPFGPEAKALLTTLNKKTDVPDLEIKQFFLEKLEKLSSVIKGSAKGKMKYSHTDGKVSFVSVKSSSLVIGGKVKKGNLAEKVLNIGFELKATNKEVLQILPVKEEKEAPSGTSKTTSDAPQGSSDVAQEDELVTEIAKITTAYGSPVMKKARTAIVKIAKAQQAKEKVSSVDLKAVMDSNTEAKALNKIIDSLLPLLQGKTELSSDAETIAKINKKLKSIISLAASVNAKKGEKSNSELDKQSVEISNKIAELIRLFGPEIEKAGLTAAFQAVQNLNLA